MPRDGGPHSMEVAEADRLKVFVADRLEVAKVNRLEVAVADSLDVAEADRLEVAEADRPRQPIGHIPTLPSHESFISGSRLAVARPDQTHLQARASDPTMPDPAYRSRPARR